MKSVESYPEYQGNPDNIQFLTRSEHLAAHDGSWLNPTNWYYDPITKEKTVFAEDELIPCKVIELSESLIELKQPSVDENHLNQEMNKSNSSKSNNLPDWDVYFGRLAKAEYGAYSLLWSDDRAKKLFDKCAKENLNNEEVRYRLYQQGQSEQHFTNQLKGLLLPIYESARNMGFRKWTYTK